MHNSTSILGHNLEVAKRILNLTITRNEEAEATNLQMLQAVTQCEDALLTSRRNLVNFDNYRVGSRNAVDAAQLSYDDQRIRTVAMHEANTVHVVQHLFEYGVQDMMQGN